MTFNPLTDIAWKAAFYAEDPSWSPPADGGAVTSWRDAGSEGKNATGTATYRAASSLNGQPAVEFVGNPTFDGLASATWTTGITNKITAVCVGFVGLSTNTYTQTNASFFMSPFSNNGTGVGYPTTGVRSGVPVYGLARGAETGANVPDLRQADGSPHVMVFEVPSTGDGSKGRIIVDGRIVGSNLAPNNAATWDGMRIFRSSAGLYPAFAQIAFVAIYDGFLPDVSRQALEAWAAAKYNLPTFPEGAINETFLDSNGSSWGPEWNAYAGSGTGYKAEIQNNQGSLNIGSTAGGVVGIRTVSDYGPNFNFTFDFIFQTASDIGYGTDMLFQDSNNLYFLEGTKGGATYGFYRKVAGVQTQLGSSIGCTIASGDTVHFRIVRSGSSFKIRHWLNSALEPTTWNLDLVDSSVTHAGSFNPYAYYNSSGTGDVLHVDNWKIADYSEDPGLLTIPYAPGYRAPATVRQIRSIIGTYDSTLPSADVAQGVLSSVQPDNTTTVPVQPPGPFGGWPGAWDRLQYFSLPHGSADLADVTTEPQKLDYSRSDRIQLNRNTPPIVLLPSQGTLPGTVNPSVSLPSVRIPGANLLVISTQVASMTISSITDNLGNIVQWQDGNPVSNVVKWAYVAAPINNITFTINFSGNYSSSTFSDQGSIKLFIFDNAAPIRPVIQAFSTANTVAKLSYAPQTTGSLCVMHGWFSGTTGVGTGKYDTRVGVLPNQGIVEAIVQPMPTNDRSHGIVFSQPQTRASAAVGYNSGGSTSNNAVVFEILPAVARPVTLVPPSQFGIGSMTMPSQKPVGNDPTVISDAMAMHLDGSGFPRNLAPSGDMELYIHNSSPTATVIPTAVTSMVIPTLTIPKDALCVLFCAVAVASGVQTVTITQDPTNPVQLTWALGKYPSGNARFNTSGRGSSEVWWAYNNTGADVVVNLTATFAVSTGLGRTLQGGIIAPVYFMNAYPSLDYSGLGTIANSGVIGFDGGTTTSTVQSDASFVMAGGTSMLWGVMTMSGQSNLSWTGATGSEAVMWAMVPTQVAGATSPGAPGAYVAYIPYAMHPLNNRTKNPNRSTAMTNEASTGATLFVEIRQREAPITLKPQAPGPFSFGGRLFQFTQPSTSEAPETNLVPRADSNITIDYGNSPSRIIIPAGVSSVTTESFTVQPGALVLMFATIATGGTAQTITGVSGGGLTWTRRLTQSVAASPTHDVWGAYNSTPNPITMTVTTSFPAVAYTPTRPYVGTHLVYVLYGASPVTSQNTTYSNAVTTSVTPLRDRALVFLQQNATAMNTYSITLTVGSGSRTTFGAFTNPTNVTPAWLYNNGDEAYEKLTQPSEGGYPQVSLTAFFQERAVAQSYSWSATSNSGGAVIVYAADQASPPTPIGPGSVAFGTVRGLQPIPAQQRVADNVRVTNVIPQDTLDLSYWRAGEILGYV